MGLEGPIAGNFVRPDVEALNSDAKSVQTRRSIAGRKRCKVAEHKCKLSCHMPEIANKSEEQKVAEAEVESFRKDLGPFVVAAETTRMAMVFTDAKEAGHTIIFANDAFLSLTGYICAKRSSATVSISSWRGADPKTLAQVEVLDGSTDHGSEIRYRRKDGSIILGRHCFVSARI